MAEGRGLSLITDEAAQFKEATAKKDPADETKDKSERARKKELVELVVKRFQTATTAEYQQRQREDEDLKFDRALPADQWPEGIRTSRAGGVAETGGVVNERPCLVINKLDQPVQQVLNEARGARISVKIKPKSDGASQEGAEIRQALYRTIEQESRAQIARLWALDRAVKCGRGAYRVTTKYTNDGDFDQDIVIERILNQGSVYLDPYAHEPDWSDGEWAIITTDVPVDEYKRRYPKSKLNGISAEELESIGNKVPGWIGTTEEEGSKTIRIAEHFYVEHEDRELVFVPGQGKAWRDELPEKMPLPPNAVIRKIDVRRVRWCVVNAEEVLEEADWDGRFIPIIPVIGKEYNVDGDRCWKGVISNSKDAQRSYNYMRSAQVEAVGLAPKAPWIMAEGQDEGYETMWDQSNTKNYTRLKYKPVDFMGKPIPPPQRNVAEPAIQAISMAVNMASEDIKSTTGRFDPSLGRNRADQSGKAINLLKESGEATTSNYLENLTSISMHYEAKVILDLMPYVYDRPGRVLRVMGEEEHQDQTVMLNKPFVMGQNGQPQPAPPPGMMERLGQAVGIGPKKRDPRFLDLRNGEYSVEVSVGKSFPTQREENAEMLRSIIESAPGLTPMLADLMVEQLDTPIAKRAADRLRKLNPQIQESEQGEQELPPEVQQKMAAMEQQMTQMTEVLQQQNEEIKSNRYKVDKDYDAKLKELQVRREIAIITAQATVANTEKKTQTDEEIAGMKLQVGMASEERDREHESIEGERERRSKVLDNELTRQFKRSDEHDKMAHEAGMTAVERQAAREERERDIEASREERDTTLQHERQMKFGDAMSRRSEQESQREHDRLTRAGDAVHERRTQAADQEAEERGRREEQAHELTKEERADIRSQVHERRMAEEQRKAEAKKPKEKK
jgi:hypothetical protein